MNRQAIKQSVPDLSDETSFGQILYQEPHVIICRHEMATIAGIMPSSVNVFVLCEIGSRSVTLSDLNGTQLKIYRAPMLCLGFFAQSDESAQRLNLLRQRFVDWSSYEFPEVLIVEDGADVREVDILLASGLVSKLRSFSSSIVHLTRELGQLREAHENLHNSFASVEAYLNARNIAPCTMIFENLPSPELVRVSDAGFSQLLPVASQGLSIVQLHSPGSSNPDDSGCIVDLETIEDRTLHCSWTVRLSEGGPNWITLALPQGIDGLKRTARLVCRPIGKGKAMMPFSLGAPQPLAHFRALDLDLANNEVALGKRGLAMRLWRGLPNVRPPELGKMAELVQRPSAGSVREIPITPMQLQSFENITTDWRPGFDPIEYIADLGGLAIHPPPLGMTAGKTSGFSTNWAIRLSATVALRHPDAKPVEFGIALTSLSNRDTLDLMTKSVANSEDGSFFFSDWQAIKFGDVREIRLEINEPLDRHYDLVVASRMTSGSTNDFAWTLMSDFRLTLLGEAPIRNPSLAAGADGGRRKGSASAVDLSSVKQISGHANMVLFDPLKNSIFCHPSPSGRVTIGQSAKLKKTSFSKISVQPVIFNQQSGVVQVCVLISDKSETELISLLNSRDSKALDTVPITSGWRDISHVKSEKIELTLNQKASSGLLYFASRMKDGENSSDYAWCHFTDVKLV